ncbi:MAG: ketoacyl-ACP synthase III [Planctomycetes bacterium]|nr:ketoacyl-ACP synthase III [Planctomycetota bacterium]
MKVKIAGTSSFAPQTILTNAELAKMVNTSDDWIVQRTGIKERRIAEDNETPSDLATNACNKLFNELSVKPEDIDLIICATSFPDYAFPSTACLIQKKLKCMNAGAYDVYAGCTGFIYAVTTGSQFIRSGLYKKVLVIGTETLSKIMNWNDRSTCILFGDGAGCVLLTESNDNSDFLHFELGADGNQFSHVILPSSGAVNPPSKNKDQNLFYVHMNGREVYKFAVNKMAELILNAVKKQDMNLGEINIIIPHQVNLRIIESALQKIDFPIEKAFINIHKYGNTSSASIPVALDEAVKQGRVQRGDHIILLAFGAGLTWGSTLIKW